MGRNGMLIYEWRKENYAMGGWNKSGWSFLLVFSLLFRLFRGWLDSTWHVPSHSDIQAGRSEHFRQNVSNTYWQSPRRVGEKCLWWVKSSNFVFLVAQPKYSGSCTSLVWWKKRITQEQTLSNSIQSNN